MPKLGFIYTNGDNSLHLYVAIEFTKSYHFHHLTDCSQHSEIGKADIIGLSAFYREGNGFTEVECVFQSPKQHEPLTLKSSSSVLTSCVVSTTPHDYPANGKFPPAGWPPGCPLPSLLKCRAEPFHRPLYKG